MSTPHSNQENLVGTFCLLGPCLPTGASKVPVCSRGPHVAPVCWGVSGSKVSGGQCLCRGGGQWGEGKAPSSLAFNAQPQGVCPPPPALRASRGTAAAKGRLQRQHSWAEAARPAGASCPSPRCNPHPSGIRDQSPAHCKGTRDSCSTLQQGRLQTRPATMYKITLLLVGVRNHR